jgi:hypothetical protein
MPDIVLIEFQETVKFVQRVVPAIEGHYHVVPLVFFGNFIRQATLAPLIDLAVITA